MKYYLKNLIYRTVVKEFKDKEHLEAWLSEYNTYWGDNNKYRGNVWCDGLLALRYSEFNKNKKAVKKIIEDGKTIFYIPEEVVCSSGYSRVAWLILREQNEMEKALERLIDIFAIRFNNAKVFMKGSYIIADEHGKIYDYNEFVETSKKVEADYFKDKINKTDGNKIYYHFRYIDESALPKYREGAVPGTGKSRGRRYSGYDISRVERELAENKYPHLVEDCDDTVVVKPLRRKRACPMWHNKGSYARHASWKEGKGRKQWMRGNKGIKVEKFRFVYEEGVEDNEYSYSKA